MADVYLSRNLRGERVLAECNGGRIIAVIQEETDDSKTRPEHFRQLAASLGHTLVYQIGTPLITID